MTEEWVRAQFGHPEWDTRAEVDLDGIITRGRGARRKRRVRRRTLGAVVTLAVVAGGAAASPLLASGRPQPAVLSPAATDDTDVAASACAGADTPAARTVQRDVDLVAADHPHPGHDEALDIVTGTVKTHLIAELALVPTPGEERVTVTASPRQIGYIDGGCAHPRYLVAFVTTSTRPGARTPDNVLNLDLVSALSVDGVLKLDHLVTVDVTSR